MDKYLVLNVKEHRSWFDTNADWWWETVSWRIFSDRTYLITISFRPTCRTQGQKKKYRRRSGELSKEDFEVLAEDLEVMEWESLDRYNVTLDGSVWELEYYNADGSVKKRSGHLFAVESGSIGQIIDLLPEPGKEMYELERGSIHIADPYEFLL